MATYEYKLDIVSSDMQNVEDLLGVPPRGVTFVYTPVVHTGGTGLAVGDGYPQCTWTFEYMSRSMLTTLLAFLGTSASVSLYINTRRPDNTYATYSAVMHRPEIPGDASALVGGWSNVTVRFTHLEAI